MGFFRFRRSIKLFPGVRINLSKTGVSTSIGRPGATVNLRGDRIKTTVGIPGSGLSYTEQKRGPGAGTLLLLAIIILAVLAAFGFF
jgi:hypothetical protein